jgi:hypothetical protein
MVLIMVSTCAGTQIWSGLRHLALMQIKAGPCLTTQKGLPGFGGMAERIAHDAFGADI